MLRPRRPGTTLRRHPRMVAGEQSWPQAWHRCLEPHAGLSHRPRRRHTPNRTSARDTRSAPDPEAAPDEARSDTDARLDGHSLYTRIPAILYPASAYCQMTSRDRLLFNRSRRPSVRSRVVVEPWRPYQHDRIDNNRPPSSRNTRAHSLNVAPLVITSSITATHAHEASMSRTLTRTPLGRPASAVDPNICSGKVPGSLTLNREATTRGRVARTGPGLDGPRYLRSVREVGHATSFVRSCPGGIQATPNSGC